MQQEEITFQTLTDNKDINIGYSDNDIVIIDSIQQFVETTSAHASMSAIAVCISGKVQGTMNGKKITLEQGQIGVIPPNVIINDLMVSPDFNIRVVFLTNSIIQSFLREKIHVWNEMMYIHELHVITLKDEDFSFYTSFYDLLQQCFNMSSYTPYRTDVIQALLRAAILALCGAMRKIAPDVADEQTDAHSSNSYFHRFLDLLHAGQRRRRSVESFANELCISPKYLSVICKKHSGKTANEWIKECVMEDIRYYLKETDLSIKQICHQMGFPNPSFFGKYVKQHFGCTPMEYRNNA